MQLPAKAMPRPPAQILPYVEILGPDLTVRFLLSFGGAELHLAENPMGRGRLEGLIGPDLARAMAEQSHRMQKRAALAKPWTAAMLVWQGHRIAEIARRLHVSDVSDVSDVSVRRWVNGSGKRHAPGKGKP
jgi:hypothetical protein